MAGVRITQERPASVDSEIARLRDLTIVELQAAWRTIQGKAAPAHLPRHLLFRIMAYRLQAEHFGDLSAESQRLLDPPGSAEQIAQRVSDAKRRNKTLFPGTILGREWNGQMHRVAVLADGFSWNGQLYPSLSKIAFAITGTRWNGPRFFGLREDKKMGRAHRDGC